MIRFKANVEKRNETTGRCACVFFVETVTCDAAAAAAVKRAVRWASGTDSEDLADESTWLYLGRDWLPAGSEGLDSEFKALLRGWLVQHVGMTSDDKMLVSTWTVGFAGLV